MDFYCGYTIYIIVLFVVLTFQFLHFALAGNIEMIAKITHKHISFEKHST